MQNVADEDRPAGTVEGAIPGDGSVRNPQDTAVPCPQDLPVDGDPDVVTLVTALQTLIVYVITVVLQTLAVHYVIANAHGFEYAMLVQSDVLRVLGSAWVDVTALYFMTHGFLLGVQCRSAATEHALVADDARVQCHFNTIRSTIPDIVLSTVPYAVMACFVSANSVWNWVYLATSPLLLSTFFDFRVSNEFRAANESMWIAQLTVIYSLLAFGMYRTVDCLAQRFGDTSPEDAEDKADRTWKLILYHVAVSWAAGFLHLYVAFQHPVLGSSITRSCLTNAVFVLAGMFVGMVPLRPGLLRRVSALCRAGSGSVGRYVGRYVHSALPVFLGCVLIFYMHHVQNTTDSRTCVTVFGGMPCLWNIDICNLRLYPWYILLMLWYTDPGLIFRNSLFGDIEKPLAHTLQHVVRWTASWSEYNMTFMLYSELIALAVDVVAISIMPVVAVRFSVLFIVADIAVVTAACVGIKRFVNPVTERSFDAFMTWSGGWGVLQRLISHIPG